MAEDKLKEFAEGLGGILAPSSQVNDPKKMLAAIQNAALLRAGIGLLGRTRMGENEYDKAGRVLDDVSTDAAAQVKALATTGTTATKAKTAAAKELRSIGKDALSAYDKLYFLKDPITGTVTQKDKDLATAKITPPSPELFKNKLYGLYLNDDGMFDKLKFAHIKAVGDRKAVGLKWEWEDSVAQYEERFGE